MGTPSFAQKNILQPGDPIIASSANNPGSEGVANAIDGTRTKYLNFDTDADAAGGAKPSGFVVTPSVGVTRITGVAMLSANDAPDRDPKVITIEGSNDDTVTTFGEGNWTLIARIDNIPSWPSVFGDATADNRYKTQTLAFENFKAYKHYRWTVLETQGPSTCCMQIAEVQLLGGVLPQDVTQPGDPLIASSSNNPGSEGVANAIDGTRTKYLNFDTDADAAGGSKPSGFVVTPSIGRTVVTGVSMLSANDAPDRDPKVITIEGSNDDTVTSFSGGNWELIKRIDDIPTWPSVFGDATADNRYKIQTFLFDNVKPYKHYRWTVLETQGPSTCCMQIAEVELLGAGAPKDITQPGDPLVASSSNNPGSEGVANAIDGTRTKYLNFDTDADAAGGSKPSGFVVTPSIGETVVIGMTILSANDAPDRDPKVVTLEGSNDDQVTSFSGGTWTQIARLEIPSWTSVFGDATADNRYKLQEFYFPNSVAYKHYRWTVLETQGPSTCCMQVAEVELLAVTQQTDCNKAKFLVQPTDMPVLAGASATFFTTVNGPWPLQWFKNGVAIPGANQTSYTTEPITAANATNIYTVEIVGCEMSSEVKANVFTPSTTKSIGVSFRGSGANGAPTLMNTNDIAGIWPQAYWNNAAGAGSGDLPDYNIDPPADLLDSSGQVSDILFNFATSGSWGSGTGIDSPTQRLLNGLNYVNPGESFNNTLTFSSVPNGTHSVIAYMVGIPLQFQDANYTVTGNSSQTAYVRVMNSDEYNAAPGFYRGVSTDPNNRDLATYVRFDNVRPDSDGTIKLSWQTLTTGFDRGAPVNALQLILNSTPAGAPPVISQQPQPTAVLSNSTARLTVAATGDNLTYQWRKNGRNLPNGGNISGATTPTLTIANVSEEDEGVYNVAIFNQGGSVVSKNAALRMSKFAINENLVGYWKFDESGGTSVANAAAGGQAGTITGMGTFAAGKVGRALNFDGGTYVIVPDYPKASKGIGVSAWVRVDAGVAGPVIFIRNGERNLQRSTDSDPRPAMQFEFGLEQDATDQSMHLSAAIMSGPNVLRATAPTAFPLGTWQHVAFTADGAQVRLYRNGSEVASTDYIGNINQPTIKYLSIGVQTYTNEVGEIIVDDTNPKLLTGQVDDLGLWTRGLSADEVSKIYAAGNQGQELTSVVITPPTPATAEISIARGTAGIAITYEGVLQSADSVGGPYAPVTGATSPYTIPADTTIKFYRAASQ